MNLQEQIIVKVTDGINNSRWEATYSVSHTNPSVGGSLFFSTDTPSEYPEPELSGKRVLVSEDLNNKYFEIKSTVGEWLKSKKEYYQADGVFFDWMELV